ncbi:MAG: DUF1801 domain-containing protein, partial [Chloroflexota bacterium]
TTYADKQGGICHVRTTKDGVDIGYLKGAQIEDEFGLLEGKTKKMRVQKLLPDGEFNEAIIHYYIQSSRALNRKSLP